MSEYIKPARIEITTQTYSNQSLRISVNISASISSSLLWTPAILPSYRVDGIAVEPSTGNLILCSQHLIVPQTTQSVLQARVRGCKSWGEERRPNPVVRQNYGRL